MAIPDYQSLLLPVLRSAEKGEVQIGSIVQNLAEELKLSDDERTDLLPSGKQTVFNNRVHWAKFYLSKAGLVESTKHGYFRLTERGRQVLASNPAKIDMQFLNHFPEFKQFKSGSLESDGKAASSVSDQENKSTPDETIRSAYHQLEREVAQDILDRVRAMKPARFERLIVHLLHEMGFGGSVPDAARPLGKPGDNGVDAVVDQDAFGLDRVYVQAKCYAKDNSVGAGDIRNFFGSLDRFKASKGLFVTSSSFSPAAQETAKSLSKRIVLVNGEQLAKLMMRHNVGCRLQETFEIKRVDEDFFE